MVLENTKYNKVIHKKSKKCEFCGRELTPIGLDYLYANFSPDNIEYERCTCKEAQKCCCRLISSSSLSVSFPSGSTKSF